MSENAAHFLLSRVSAFESSGLVVVDQQEMKAYCSAEEVGIAFSTLNLVDFAVEYRKRLGSNDRLVAVSKIVSLCDPDGRSTAIVREDFNVVENILKLAQ